MKFLPLFIALTAIALPVSTAFSASSVPGELLVKYRTGAYPDNLQGELAKIGWAKIKIEKSKRMSQAMMALKNDPDIIYVEPNYYGEFFLTEPDDPALDQQWYLPNINALKAWDKSLGAGVVIGLVDSGVDLTHEDLAGNILADGRDFGDDDDDPTDELGHGTQVCGVIAAVQNNGLGISGIAPECKILPLKVNVGSLNEIKADAAAEAIIYAADYGVKIINLSLGWSEGESSVVIEAIKHAADKGVLLVAAAGNADGPIWFPANQDEVISVSATKEDNTKKTHSASGPELDLVAPGVSIRTTYPGDAYTIGSGTSFSSPIVSAVAALLLSQHPHLTRNQVREYLIMRADDLDIEGKDDVYGYGKVNALKTLDPLISFAFPHTILGSRNLPFIYLLAIFSKDAQFTLFNTQVSFESAHITPLGHPIVLLPACLFQMVILESNPSEGCSNITVTTVDETVDGYDVLTIGLLSWNL
jgi:subtilisin family serine protease